MSSVKVALAFVLFLALGVAPVGSASAQSRAKTKPARHAKVSMKKARATALAKVPGGRIQAAELEREQGKLIYSFDIRVPHKPGIEEVHVDAMTGAVIGMSHEGPKAERKEAQQERQETQKDSTGAKTGH